MRAKLLVALWMSLSLSLSIVAYAQESSTLPAEQTLPGEVNLMDLSAVYGEAKVEINLPRAMIQMVTTFARKEDPEVAALIQGIDRIKVMVYDMKGKPEQAMQAVDTLTRAIRKDDWQPLVSVNEEGSKVRMMSRISGDKMDGLVVMVVDEGQGEAVFINIVGQIDPAQISKVTESLNIKINQ